MHATLSARWAPWILGLVCLLSTGSSMASWAAKCATANVVCVEVSVSSVDGTITLDREPVKLMSSSTTVFWKLPEGYVFEHLGAGVAVPHNGEVTKAGGVADDEKPTGQLTKRYRIVVKRLIHDSYKYAITFDEINGGKPTRRFVCDPTIANSGGILDTARTPARTAAGAMESPPIACKVTSTP